MALSGGRRSGEALIGLAAVAMGLFLLNANLQSRHDDALLRRRGIEAPATVTQVERRAFVSIVGGNTSATPVHRVTVAFSDQEGRSHTAAFDRRPSGVQPGDAVRVLYDPVLPRRSTIVDPCTLGGLWCDRTSIVGFVLAGVLLLFGAGFLASGPFRRRAGTSTPAR